MLASVDIEAGGASLRHASVRIPVVPADPAAGSAAPGAEIPEYVRQQCERRGFKPSVERRYLFARLPDGRQVVVPVDQLQLNPIPLTIN